MFGTKIVFSRNYSKNTISTARLTLLPSLGIDPRITTQPRNLIGSCTQNAEMEKSDFDFDRDKSTFSQTETDCLRRMLRYILRTALHRSIISTEKEDTLSYSFAI